MSAVLFVVMPFGGLERPHLGVGLLKAQLRAAGVPATVAYLNFPFAEALGYEPYHRMSDQLDGYLYYALAGEWLFSRSLFSRRGSEDDKYIEGYLFGGKLCARDMVNCLRRMSALVEPYLDHCLRTVDWQRYSIIGFTSTFEQTLACLALAKRIKERFPDKIIVMGGPNCAGVMGLQLHRSFPFLDYVFTCEADFGFPELVSRLGSGESRRDDIPGHVRREGGKSVAVPATHTLQSMDSLPYPDFDDYFAAYRLSPLSREFAPVLQMETARGCWWGAKHHCTFCGLNLEHMGFRAKSAQRALDELVHLVSRHGVIYVAPTDNILSMDYFRTLLPELKRRNLGIKLFYETKANLDREQVQLLHDSGVTSITPGIESLSGHVLALMNKGVSPLQNVQLLKWCREYGVHPFWNLLCGIPGENAADYAEVHRIAKGLTHLTPPTGLSPISLERFSPFFERAAEYGIRNVRAYPSYGYVYPFEGEVLDNLAYFFDFDFDGKEKIDDHSGQILALIEQWKQVQPVSRLEVVARTPDSIVVHDTRPNRMFPLYRFGAREAAVIDACDRAQGLPQIVEHVRKRLNGSIPHEAWIRDFVRYLTRCRLFLEHDGRYLSLILSQPPPAAPRVH